MVWTKEAREKAILSKKLNGNTNQFDKAKRKGIELISPLKGRKGISRKHTEETKNKLRELALASKHRRLCRSIREYKCKDGSIVVLDSSWEEELAKRLDFLNINWIRPKDPIRYLDNNGKEHSYFPDFYLPEYDILLDPKNPAALFAQKEKVDILKNMLTNLVILSNIQDIKEYTPVARMD